jgi:hypothetical protein
MPSTLDIVSPEWDLFVGVPTETELYHRFCETQGIQKGGNVKHAADPNNPRYLFAESYQGAYNVRFLQRVGLENQLPVLEAPDGLVLVTDEAKNSMSGWCLNVRTCVTCMGPARRHIRRCAS